MRTLRAGSRGASRGFTLIEAMLSVMLLALITTLVLPSFQSVYVHAKLKDSVRTFAGTLRFVRATAIGSNEARRVVLNFEQHRYQTKPNDIVTEIPKSIEIHQQSNDGFGETEPLGIVFYPNGGSSGGQVLFHAGKKYYLVSVSPITGRVQVQSIAASEINAA